MTSRPLTLIPPLPGRIHTRAIAALRRPVVTTRGAFLTVAGGLGTRTPTNGVEPLRGRAALVAARHGGGSGPCTPSASTASVDRDGSSGASRGRYGAPLLSASTRGGPRTSAPSVHRDSRSADT